jgi:hypothetical membrane protein
MMIAIIVVVGQITPDYDPLSDTVSQMGAPERPYARVLNGGYAVYGVLMALAAAGLPRNVGFTTRGKRLALLLMAHALGTILLGVFPDTLDLEPKGFTDDLLHNTVSVVSSLPLLGGILVLRGISHEKRALRVAGILGMVIIVINMPVPAIPRLAVLQPVSGLLQRLLSGAPFLWLAATFALLYRDASQPGARATLAAGVPDSSGECTEAADGDRIW